MEGSESEEEEEIGLAEWVKGKKPISCPFGKKEPEAFGFDTSKVDKIFDLLLQEGQIKLSPYHTIPSAEQLKKMKYCKWHNATSHDTNECKIFLPADTIGHRARQAQVRGPDKASEANED